MNNVFGYPRYDEEGVKVITRTEGTYASSLQNITVYNMKCGEERCFTEAKEEMAVLLVEGDVTLTWEGKSSSCKRSNFIKDDTICLHVCKGKKVVVKANADSEVLLQTTPNDKGFESILYNTKNTRNETFGKSQFEGKAQRTVRTFFDYHNAPYSNMVIGEIIIPQGGWSSYPPHQHPQPEVYYYRFLKPQGFGACFIDDEVYKIKDGSFVSIPGGKTHPQVNAPGYPMYYVWMIRHFDNAPWTDRIFDPAHKWLLDEK